MSMIKRAVITLYSNPLDPHSHQVRLVLAEKGVTVDIVKVDLNNLSEDLLEINPYGTTPTLVDRDLTLFDSRIVMEYLEERFPHPPLLPVYPIARAKCRLLMYRIERDWYGLLNQAQTSDTDEAGEARRQITSGLVALNTVLGDTPYFLSEDYTLVDCCMAPLLWRLPHLDIEIPKQAKNVLQYKSRLFKRDAFQASLSDLEREM
jgi:RNA polymerase-associated protein